MTTESTLAKLHGIDPHSDEWKYDPSSRSYVIEVGDLTITVVRGPDKVDASWSVHYSRHGHLIMDIPADNTIIARRDALQWARKWLAQFS